MTTAQTIIDATPTNGVADLADISEILEETLVINRSMTVCNGDIRSIASDGLPMVEATADRVSIKDMRIAGVGNRPGIRLEGNFSEISGCSITGAYAGIVAARTATHCVFTRNRITKGTDNGIYLSSARHCVVSENVIWDYQGHSGIKVRGWGNVIANNVVYDVPIGITVTGINGSEFPEFNWRKKINGYGNIVANNTTDRTRQYGIFMDVNGGWLWGTRITDNTVTNAVRDNVAKSAIRVYGPMTVCSGNSVSLVSAQAIAAIDAYEADHSFIVTNTISNSEHGIVVDPDRSIFPVITPNQFFDVRS